MAVRCAAALIVAGVLALNPEPVMMTEVFPVVGPESGLSAVTLGAPMIQTSL